MEYSVNGSYDDFEESWTYRTTKPMRVRYSSQDFPGKEIPGGTVWGLNFELVAIGKKTKDKSEEVISNCMMHCSNMYPRILQSLEFKCNERIIKKDLDQESETQINSNCIFTKDELKDIADSNDLKIRIKYPQETIFLKNDDANQVKKWMQGFYDSIYKPESPLFNSEEDVSKELKVKETINSETTAKSNSYLLATLGIVIIAMIWSVAPTFGLIALVGFIIYIYKKS